MTLDEIMRLHNHTHAVKRLNPVLPSRGRDGIRPSGFDTKRLASFFDDPEIPHGIKHELAIGIATAIESAIEREISRMEAAIEHIAGQPVPPPSSD